MERKFPLFQSHIDLSQSYWKRLVNNQDWVIDATSGNGRDTLALARIACGVIAIDSQLSALKSAKKFLENNGSELVSGVHFFHQSHETFPDLAKKHPIKLIVYNLGYLPGGNKEYTTRTDTTLQSVKNALSLVCEGGCLSITCYPGHAEGERETEALRALVSSLPQDQWNCCIHTFMNRTAAPLLILIQKNISFRCPDHTQHLLYLA